MTESSLKSLVPELRHNSLQTKGRLVRIIGNCGNVRGLGKSMVVFRLFEKLRHSNERSTKFESLYHE